MTAPRVLRHPGPQAAIRHAALPCHAHPVTLRLDPGLPFDQAVARAFAAAGFAAGYLRLCDLRFARLAWVMPAPAPGDGRAAWYSATEVFQDAVLHQGGLHLGQRDGAPFMHCHGVWSGPEAVPRMGHLLNPESTLATAAEVTGWGLSGARLEVAPDPETGFALFSPRAEGLADPGGAPALLCTLRPNSDPHALLPQIAAQHGVFAARIKGLGSLVGVSFTEGRIADYATELLLTGGRLDQGRATLEAVATGFDGHPHAGGLAEGRNRICITAELLILPQV